MSTDNSLSLPPENVLYVKPAPFMLFRRSWSTCVFEPQDFLPISLPVDQKYGWTNAGVMDQTDAVVKICSAVFDKGKWLATRDYHRPFGSHKLYCLVDASKGLDLRELAKLNNCPVVSYTGYVPECEGTVVVIELLD